MKALRLLVSLPLLLLVGCGHFAQSPEEWVMYHKQGTTARGKKEVDVKRPKKAVEADLAEYASKCVNGMVTVSRLEQGMQLQISKGFYTARVKSKADATSLLSIQAKFDEGYPGTAPEGDFMFVAEVNSTGASNTRVVGYYVTTSPQGNAFANDVSEWSNGIKRQCPKTR